MKSTVRKKKIRSYYFDTLNAETLNYLLINKIHRKILINNK
jgi:hypothetical protein